jgi:hypothetical protein
MKALANESLRGLLFFGYNNGTTFSFFADFEKQAVKPKIDSHLNNLIFLTQAVCRRGIIGSRIKPLLEKLESTILYVFKNKFNCYRSRY